MKKLTEDFAKELYQDLGEQYETTYLAVTHLKHIVDAHDTLYKIRLKLKEALGLEDE